jgi:ppGpp synthetase/RelA/SpoT-type nucleotidyltranferase
MFKVGEVRTQPRPLTVRKLTIGARRLADRVGNWLFPNPGALLGWQPAALGPCDIPNIMLMEGKPTGGPRRLSDEMELTRETMLTALQQAGGKETENFAAAFAALNKLPAEQRERNLRMAFQLLEWRADNNVVVASLLLGIDTMPSKINEATRDSLASILRLDALPCNCTSKEQIAHYRNLLFQLADSADTLLALAAKDLSDLRLYEAGIKAPKRERLERAFHTGSWLLKYLGVKEYGELEDLALLHLDPAHYKAIEERIELAIGMDRSRALERLQTIAKDLTTLLDLHEIPHRLLFRVKRLISFERKCAEKSASLDSIGIRVIITSNRADHCYLALFRIREHLEEELFGENLPQYNDYIAKPKPSTYQALHSQFKNVSDDYPLEIQVRTEEMDWNAEFGRASHAFYKSGDAAAQVEIENRSTVLAQRFLAKKETLAKAGVRFIYDPAGTLYKLVTVDPAQPPTLLDFALARNLTEGLYLQGGRVNGQLTKLGDPLKSGDVVVPIKGARVLSQSRALNVNTSLGQAIIQALARGEIASMKLAEEPKLVERGKKLFAELYVAISRAFVAEHARHFSLSDPHLRFSLERLAKRKGFADSKELFLVMSLFDQGHLTTFQQQVAAKVRENALVVATKVEGRSAALELLALNQPGVMLELLSLLEKYGLKITAFGQKPIRGNAFGLLRLSLQLSSQEKYGQFISDLENLYRDVPPPATQFGKIISIRLRLRPGFDKTSLLEPVLHAITDLGANVSQLQLQTETADECSLAIQLPQGGKGRKAANMLSKRLEEIKGVRGITILT